ncbi:MAG TPA: sigma-70 family RNA polymerase sigma factor [Saprospiraceae bacterium]|nr:sigma-70 family RNA polymerase sigma factor [Saprospiraceae bacterium]
MKEEKALNIRFQEIIGQHKGILLKVARTYCRNEEDRQDLIQEMMIQIWKSLPRYNDDFAITTWLYRIGLNVAISFYRKNKQIHNHRIPLEFGHRPAEEEMNIEKQNQFILLEQFISELNEFDKALILLYLEDKSHAETAAVLGLSVSNVGTKLGRIKEKLRNKFSQFKKYNYE